MKPSLFEESRRLASSSGNWNKSSLSSQSLEIITHNPWLTLTTPSNGSNKHVVCNINWHTCKQERITDASIQMVLLPEIMHLTNTSRQWSPNSCPNKAYEADTPGKYVVTLYNKIYHTPHQISPGYQDQASAIFMKENGASKK